MSRTHTIAIIAGQLVVGGAERQLYLWLSRIDRHKFRPIVLTLHPGHGDYWEKPIESLGIPLLQIPHRRFRLLRLLDIINILRPFKPKLIHGWHLFTSPSAGLAAKILGSKSLGGVRGSLQSFQSAPLEAGLTLNFVDAMVVNSNSTAEQLQSIKKANKQTIYTVQNAVEVQAVDRLAIREELNRQFGISKTGVWIGSLGRFDPKKHFDLILKVLALLRDAGRDFHFLLMGDGPERSHLEGMVESLGLTGLVTFTGEVPRARAWLSALDIFCFTSLDEGLPNVVMEAAVAGVPVVAWRVSFVEELLEAGSMSLLVEPENLCDFKDALVNLIQYPEIRIKLGEAGRNHILAEFSLDRYVQRMTSVYEELLGMHRASISGEL